MKLSKTFMRAFSLVEMVITVAIIGVLSAMVITNVVNANKDAGRMIARQQQAALNSAIRSWMAANVRNPADGTIRSVSDLRDTYNAAGSTSSLARFNTIVAPYLDAITTAHFTEYSGSGPNLKTSALVRAGQYITLPNWAANSTEPEVQLLNN